MLIFEPPLPAGINTPLLERISQAMSEKDVELVVCDAETIREINREHRGMDKATDVLSFPLEPLEGLPLGSVVICWDVLEEKAREYKHTPAEEAALLFIHGVLHLLGFDHEEDAGEMRLKEEAWIHRFGLPASLIVRTEDAGGH